MLGFRSDFKGIPLSRTYRFWDHVWRVIESLHHPAEDTISPLRTVVIECDAEAYCTDPNSEPGSHRARRPSFPMVALEDVLLRMPTPLERVLFVPSERNGEDESVFGEVDRRHIRRVFAQLEARGLLWFERD